MIIEERVKAVFKKHGFLNMDNYSENAILVKDLGADWLDLIEITMEIEKEFNICISDEEFEKFVTVKDIIKYLTLKTK